MDEWIRVHEFHRNGGDYSVRIDIRKYKGTSYLDVRLWYPGDHGEPIPTKKGVAVPMVQAGELKKGVDRAIRKWKKEY